MLIRVNLHIDDGQLKEADRLAVSMGMTRANFVRLAIQGLIERVQQDGKIQINIKIPARRARSPKG